MKTRIKQQKYVKKQKKPKHFSWLFQLMCLIWSDETWENVLCGMDVNGWKRWRRGTSPSINNRSCFNRGGAHQRVHSTSCWSMTTGLLTLTPSHPSLTGTTMGHHLFSACIKHESDDEWGQVVFTRKTLNKEQVCLLVKQIPEVITFNKKQLS